MYNPDAKDLNLMREYSPEYFALCSRYQVNPPNKYFKEWQDMALKTREQIFQSGIKCKHLRYAGVNDMQVVDMFYKEGNDCKPSPLFVFIHGGKWIPTIETYRLYIFMVGPLVKKGYRVAVMGHTFQLSDELINEFCGFVTWIFQFADRTQTPDITFAGHDTGAHLMTQLLHMPSCIPDCSRAKVKSMFFLTGIYDLREYQSMPKINLWNLDEQQAIDLSPILWSWKDEAQKWGCLQIHVLSVEHESVTYQEQSRQFSQVLEAAGFNSTFKKFDGLDHISILTDLKEENAEITNYFKTAMQKASGGSSKGSNRPCTCASKR